MSDNEREITQQVVQIVEKSDKKTKKKIRKEFNKLRSTYQGEDLIYEIAAKIN